ncbi:hypothetical protein CAter282_0501 [Collimonas arenae]|uniref:Uncharacterized protein n=1 Tax=Collimonas arenae TaxID=279058 RepID=A0A127PL20_9BURK|nr:hypothetical protein CAter10_0535 [Collimonas arenae]AMP08316.1 hypothetical protein CAter282_0501 [Collimonas arenae]
MSIPDGNFSCALDDFATYLDASDELPAVKPIALPERLTRL